MILRLTGREVAETLLAGLRAQGKLTESGDVHGVKFTWTEGEGLTAEVGPPFVGPVPEMGRVVPESDAAAWRRRGS